MLKYDPFNSAGMIGESWYRQPGRQFFMDLQISHTLLCTGRSVFDDNPSARSRRHLLIQAGTGVGKTSIVMRYLEDCAGVANIMESEMLYGRPTMLDMSGSGVTWERARGSSTDKGNLIKPLLLDANYLVATEFMAFMGNNPKEQFDRANEMCRVLEEGTQTVALVKMFGGNDKSWEKFEEAADAAGISTNSEHRGMSYKVDLTMVGATRPLKKEEDNAQYLWDSGLLPRYTPSVWNPSEQQKREFRRRQFGTPNPKHIARLRKFNLFAFQTEIVDFNEPPIEHINEVMDFYHDHYENICEDASLSIDEVASGRDRNDAAQLLAAKAAARAFVDAEANQFKTIDEILYERRDVEWVMRYREPYLANLYDECMSRGKEDPNIQRIRDMLVKYITKQMRENGRERDDNTIQSKELIQLIIKEFSCKKTAAYDRVGDMKVASIIEKHEFKIYHIVDKKVLHETGIQVS